MTTVPELMAAGSVRAGMLSVIWRHQASKYGDLLDHLCSTLDRKLVFPEGLCKKGAKDGLQFWQGLQNPFQAARYHSLVIDKDSCPDDLEVTAWTEDGVIMGVQHKQFPHIQVDPPLCRP